jgi:hypothetical protein
VKKAFSDIANKYTLFTVRSIVRHAIKLQFDINVNALEIRAVQSPKCKSDVLLTVLFRLINYGIKLMACSKLAFICFNPLTVATSLGVKSFPCP